MQQIIFVNLIGQKIVICEQSDRNGHSNMPNPARPLREIPAEGKVARVVRKNLAISRGEVIIDRVLPAEVENLPEPCDGVNFIVPPTVLEHLKKIGCGREDLIAPSGLHKSTGVEGFLCVSFVC